MKSKKYWIERTTALEEALQDAAADITEDIIRAYERAIEEINIDIHNTFKAYVAMGIPEKEATKLLNAAEKDKLYQELRELYANTEDFTVREDILNRINAQAYVARISRLEGVKAKAYIQLRQAANLAEKKQKQLYTKTLQSSYYTNIYNIAKGINCGIDFTVLPQKAIDKVLHEPWHGNNYSERIWIHNDRFIGAVQDAITTGIITGQSVNRVASTLTEYVKDTSPDGVITSTTTLVRTETSHFMNQGQLEAYKDIGITRYRFVAALSERTCVTCGDLDGKVFEVEDAVEGKNYPPIHPNCRCATVMADAISSTRAAKDPLTGKSYKVNGNMTFNKWKDSLTDEQRKAMELHVRQMRNSSADKKQYEKYKQIYGKDFPKTLEEFVDMKYNDSNKWEMFKAGKQDRLNEMSFENMKGLVSKLGNKEVRLWYKAKDENIINLIDKTQPLEQQARQAHRMRNQYRFEARELMKNQEERKVLDENKKSITFEQLVEHKKQKYGLLGDEIYKDILKSSGTTNKEYDKKAGLE